MTGKYLKIILLVDNDPASSKLTGEVLKKNGYKVIRARTGKEVVKKADTAKVDLAIIDIESCEDIDISEADSLIIKNKNLPVIFQYSLTNPDIVKKTEHIDSCGYIMKNSGESVLMACIRTALRRAEKIINDFSKPDFLPGLHTDLDMLKTAGDEIREKNKKIEEFQVELDTAKNIFRILNEELCRNNSVLKEREELYRTLFENTDAGIIVVEEDTTISLANKVFADSFGFTREDIQNRKKWTEMVVEEDRSFMLMEHHLRRVDPVKAKSNYEFRFKNGQGELRYYLIFISIIPGTKRSIASIIDITERKKNEAALKAAEEKYKDLFMNSQIGIFRTEIDSGHILEANDCFAQLYGYKSREELLAESTTVEKFYIDKNVRKKMMLYMKKNGEIRNYEAQFKRRDESVFWIRYSARLLADKGWTEGVTEDITALKFIEAERNAIYSELLASEKKYRLIFENSTLGLHHFNNKGILTHCNSSFERITGAAWSDLIGLNLLELPDKTLVAAVKEALNGRSGKFEGVYQFTKSGIIKLIRVQFEAVFDENEKIIGGVGLVEDITDKRAAERSMLEELEKERSRVGHILHDSLGQKLGAVLYLTQAFLKKYDKTGKLLKSDVQKLLEIASSALEETRTISRGLDLPAIDIGSFSDSLEEILMRMRNIYGIDIDLEADGVLGNYNQLKLINLYYIILESINNAIRHGKADKIALRYYNKDNEGFFSIVSFQKGKLNFDNSGMGLRIMKHRAEVAGMEFSISSKGKRVEVIIKLGDTPDDTDKSPLNTRIIN